MISIKFFTPRPLRMSEGKGQLCEILLAEYRRNRQIGFILLD